ncbi:hypothetical protein BG011_000162 [Mortierella polycephala]|uniref:F-box domain-containing protein n=1 Tax=Mortierella polycephala TaxID=41804 RepID=A0A9P6Q8H4_9FUNG|nr:hypothetical protein BG011_000162 [Mortierella polycephala]
MYTDTIRTSGKDVTEDQLPDFVTAIQDMIIIEKAESQQHASENQSAVSRVPTEVWVHICKYLYMSQLAQLSMTSKYLCDVVASLPLWRTWFMSKRNQIKKLFEHQIGRKDLSVIPKTDSSRFFVRYLCAISLQVCEQCRRMIGAIIRRPVDPNAYPLPVVFSSTMCTGPSGAKEEFSWTIRLCLRCRRDYYRTHEEPIPHDIQESYITKEEIRAKYHIGHHVVKLVSDRRMSAVPALGNHCRYAEIVLLKKARDFFGGDVGIMAHAIPVKEQMVMVRNRIDHFWNIEIPALIADHRPAS